MTLAMFFVGMGKFQVEVAGAYARLQTSHAAERN
jgi:hypothetical protein